MIKTAIVIGGSKRLGFQITRYLLKNHYQVFVLSRTENFISKIERKIPIDNLTVYKMDLADLEEVDFATNKLLENIQKVDLIFNIAGSEYLGKLETIGFDTETQQVIKARLRRMEADRAQKDDRRDDRLKKREIRRVNRNSNK